MYSKVLWKCFLVSVCFLMCPKRVRVQDIKLPVEQKELPENVSSPVPDKLALPENVSSQEPDKLALPENVSSPEPDKLALPENVSSPAPDNLALHRKNKLKSASNDQGFDFTEEEMAKFKIWPQGVVPYYMDDLSFDNGFRNKLRSFLESVSGSGLHFIELSQPPKDQSRWVFFINRRGALECSDYTTDDFTNTGVQRVILGYDCLDRERSLAGTVLALAGVPPQHNAPDRDKYVQVYIENVLPDKQNLFKSLSNDEWLFHDLEYDYNSAGHFEWNKYSANGKATIKAKQKFNEDDANNRAFTFTDLQKIRMLYNFICKHANVGNSKTGECNKLFVPGQKLKLENDELDSEENIKPRIKPNKYLGISDDVKNSAAGDQDNIANESTKKEENYEGNVKKDDKGSIEIQNEEENGNKEGDSVLLNSKKENKIDDADNQEINANEQDGIEASIKDDASKDMSKKGNDIDNGQDHNSKNYEGNVKKDDKGSIEIQNDEEENYNKEGDSVQNSKNKNKIDNADSQEINANEEEGIQASIKDDGTKDTSKKGNDGESGQNHNVIENKNGIKENDDDNDGEDSANKNINQVNNKIRPPKYKLSLFPKSTIVTQNSLFDESDLNTEERWAKLKMEVRLK